VPTAVIDGIEIHYERSGNGPRLLFLNGSGATIPDAAAMLETFGRRFDVVAYEQRGIGRSGMPAGPYAMADLAAEAVGLVDHLGWATFSVMGASFGGMVAQELAVTVPERIERLALVCTSAGGKGGASYPLHAMAGLDPQERARTYRTIMDTRFTEEWLAGHPAERELIETMSSRQDVHRPETARAGPALQMQARTDHDVYDRLDRISCPTLVASGRYDGIAPPANGKAIADRIPGAELRLFEGGHLFTIQDPEALPAILAFLAADPRN
jgi:3-oxoadipate enol-lactonase